MDALLQVVHVEQVVLPARVDDLQHHGALDAAHLLLADEALALVVLGERVVDGEVDDFLQRRRAEIDVALLEGRVVDLPETDEEGVEVPLLGELLALEVHAHRALHELADHLADLLAEVLAHEDALPLAVDHTPLLVHDLVVLEHVLAAQEVELLDLDLRLLDHAAQHLGLERLSLLGPQAAEDAVHAVAGEQADELVLRGQVEARVTGVSLPAGTAAQLVVDAPALVALGAEHIQAAGIDDALAELDVDAAAGHVGRDRERALLAGVLDDLGLALVLLGVQHVVLHAVPLEETREHLADLHRDRADEHRLTLLVARDEVVDDGRELLFGRREDEVVLVLADHRRVGGDLHHVEAVDLAELVFFGLGRAGHPGQHVVHAEVVLQRDGGEGLVLLADRHLLLGLDSLVEALGVATPIEDAAGELVDDEHLAVLHHVFDVLVVERFGAQGLDEVVDQPAVGVFVEVVDVEGALDLGHAALGDGHGALLLVDLVVFDGVQARHDARKLTIGIGGRLGSAADDERRARFVDEDGVDFVDDAEVMAALHHVLAPHRHVVAQVVEAELGVGAVGDVGVVLRAALLRRHVGLDDADLQAEEAVDLAHPLGVALGQVVVDGDEMGAVAGHRVEVHGHGGHERLALAGLHLGDVAVVKHDAAQHLDVEGPHVERPFGRLAGDGEGLVEQLVEQLAVVVALPELSRLGAQLLVAESGHLGLELSDPGGLLPEALEAPALAGAQQLVDDLDHGRGTPGSLVGAQQSLSHTARPASHRRADEEVRGHVGRPRSGRPQASVLGRLDEAVVAVVAPVHHVRAVGLGVSEHEEVVPHQLELQGGLVDRHGLERELLGLDDAAVVAGVRGLTGELVGQGRRGGHRRELGSRFDLDGGLVVPVSCLAVHLVVILLHASRELVGHQIDGCVHVGRRFTRADHRAAREHRRFRYARLRDAGVLLDPELELYPRHLVDLALLQELVDVLDLLVGVVLQGIGHGDVATLDLDLHGHRSFCTAWSSDAWEGVARTVRANVKT